MFNSANMGLTIWDQALDDFSHSQLSQNFLALDAHDHSSSKGVQITSAGLAVNSVTATQIAQDAVGNSELADLAVGTSNIQDGAVTAAKISAGAISGSLIASGAITSDKLDPTIVPLGATMLWWRPPGSGATPGGFWEAMDGRAWNTITNAWGLTTGTIPDTRGIFIKGQAISNIGLTGGSSTVSLAHSHNVNPHAHTVLAHVHGIGADGSHIHLWQGGLHVGARTNSFKIGASVPSSFGGQLQNTFYSLYIENLLSNPAWGEPSGPGSQTIDGVADMDPAGSHSHGGATAANVNAATTSDPATTDSQLGSTTVDPPWLGLMYIMRVR